MSGGRFNYVNDRVADEMEGKWHDEELNELFDAVAKMLGYVKKRTCRYVWDKKQHAWVCDQCGGIEPASNDVSYCCDCGAEVVG